MKLPLKPVLCLAFVLGTSAVSHAATINFATAQDWAGESDVLSTGVLNYAYTWTNAARTVMALRLPGRMFSMERLAAGISPWLD